MLIIKKNIGYSDPLEREKRTKDLDELETMFRGNSEKIWSKLGSKFKGEKSSARKRLQTLLQNDKLSKDVINLFEEVKTKLNSDPPNTVDILEKTLAGMAVYPVKRKQQREGIVVELNPEDKIFYIKEEFGKKSGMFGSLGKSTIEFWSNFEGFLNKLSKENAEAKLQRLIQKVKGETKEIIELYKKLTHSSGTSSAPAQKKLQLAKETLKGLKKQLAEQKKITERATPGSPEHKAALEKINELNAKITKAQAIVDASMPRLMEKGNWWGLRVYCRR